MIPQNYIKIRNIYDTQKLLKYQIKKCLSKIIKKDLTNLISKNQ